MEEPDCACARYYRQASQPVNGDPSPRADHEIYSSHISRSPSMPISTFSAVSCMLRRHDPCRIDRRGGNRKEHGGGYVHTMRRSRHRRRCSGSRGCGAGKTSLARHRDRIRRRGSQPKPHYQPLRARSHRISQQGQTTTAGTDHSPPCGPRTNAPDESGRQERSSCRRHLRRTAALRGRNR